MHGKASPAAIERYLKGIEYPVRKQDLIRYAKNHDASKDVIDVLNRMPDQEYKSPVDVSKGVGQVE